MSALDNINTANRALAEARSLTDVLIIRDAATAAAAYAAAKGADEAAQMAQEIKLRSERKAGQFIIEYKEQGLIKRGNPQLSHDVTFVKLADYGIERNESMRWQRIASIPDDRFEEYIEKAKVKTQSALLSVAREIRQEMEAEVIGEELKTADIKAKIKNCHYLNLVEQLGPRSVDLLITDPPYMTDVEDIDTFVQWLNPVLETVKDTGQAYIFTGAYYEELKAYITQLDKDEATRFTKQILVWEYRNTLGPSPKNKYKQNWQAIFYLRGPEAPPINTDSLTEKFTVQEFNMPGMLGQSINYHTWEKPLDLAKQLIRHGSTSDSLVFDPFAGTGTFLIAAADLGRKNIGCDIDKKMVEIANKRGCVIKTD